MYLFIVLLLLFLPLMTGMEVSHIKLIDDVDDGIPDKLEVEEGAPLHIPCMFFVQDFDPKSHLSLEWGMRNITEDTYTAIIRLQDSRVMHIHHPNLRAHMELKLVPKGLCTLTIDGATPEDSGLYELHLAIDELPYLPPPQVIVSVVERLPPDILAATTSTSLEEQQQRSLNEDLDDVLEDNSVKDVRTKGLRSFPHQPQPNINTEAPEQVDDWIAVVLKNLNKGVEIPYFALIGGAILLVLILGCVTACFFRIRRTSRKDKFTEMEEGCLNEDPNPVTPETAGPPIATPAISGPPLPLRSPALPVMPHLGQDGILAGYVIKPPLNNLPEVYKLARSKKPKRNLKAVKNGKRWKTTGKLKKGKK